MRIFALLILSALLGMPGMAQELKGIIFEKDDNGLKTPLVGASVYFPGTAIGTTTGPDGKFSLRKPEGSPDSLVISYIGFTSDTVAVTTQNLRWVLKKSVTLTGIEIKARRPETYISLAEPIKTEVLTTAELQKNACCNLSESFESNPTVDASFTDAVTGARQIQMLGLAGRYVQALQDVLPPIRGLNQVHGFNNIPGPWVESIHVIKGTGSVVNGFESITGQIDVELKKPENTDKLYLNLYGNTEGRAEANALYSHSLNRKLSTMMMMHGSTLQNKNDHNNDFFIDQPVYRRYNLMNRWKYDSGKRIEAMAGIIISEDDRTGGDIRFSEATDKGSTRYYGLGINTRHWEAFSKVSLGFYGQEYKSIGLMLSFMNHNVNSYYGLRSYTGLQQSAYVNLIYQSVFTDTRHTFKTGASLLYDRLDESFQEIAFDRIETIPGVFFEYTFNDLSRWTFIAGMRTDHHNDYGFFYSPRFHIRKKMGEQTSLRLSAGRGYRVPHVFSDNPSVLVSSRELVFLEALKVEHAWNYGINFTHCFLALQREAQFSADYYRTDFTNQVVVDLYADPTKAYFFNLKGSSFSNNLQLQLTYEVITNLKLKAAIKFFDVQTDYLKGRDKTPLNPSRRGLFNAAYETPTGKWKFDFTTQWVGKQQLPIYLDNADQLTESVSPAYVRMLGQVTFLAGRWDLYLGAENLGDYTQPHTVINPEDPFGKHFDAGIVWGPVSGRMIYAGLRFVID